MARIQHLADPSQWAAAKKSGEYRESTRGQSLAEVGFIHASFPHQVPAVRSGFYADVTSPLVVLDIDPERLTAPLIVETGDPTTGEEFPHIFGPINCEAVVGTRTVQPPHDISTIAFDVQRMVQQPRDAVWAALTEWSTAARWIPGVDLLSGDGPAVEGTRLEFSGDLGTGASVVTCVWPLSLLTLTSTRGPVRADYTYLLTERGDGSAIRLVADVEADLPAAEAADLRGHIAAADGGQLDALAEWLGR